MERILRQTGIPKDCVKPLNRNSIAVSQKQRNNLIRVAVHPVCNLLQVLLQCARVQFPAVGMAHLNSSELVVCLCLQEPHTKVQLIRHRYILVVHRCIADKSAVVASHKRHL